MLMTRGVERARRVASDKQTFRRAATSQEQTSILNQQLYPLVTLFGHWLGANFATKKRLADRDRRVVITPLGLDVSRDTEVGSRGQFDARNDHQHFGAFDAQSEANIGDVPNTTSTHKT